MSNGTFEMSPWMRKDRFAVVIVPKKSTEKNQK